MRSEKQDIDAEVIIVGGNVAGASLGRRLAERGVDTLLIERRKKGRVGYGMFGEALAYHQFRSVGMEMPEGDFITRDVVRITLYPPDERTSLTVRNVGKNINRYRFNQHLIEKAEDAGVRITDETVGETPVIEEGAITGVRVRDRNSGEKRTLKSNILVDATGVKGHLRRQLPDAWVLSEKARAKDTAVCYVEVRAPRGVSAETRAEEGENKPFLKAYFSQEVSPGGAHWFASDVHSPGSYTLGLGVYDIPSVDNPKKIFYDILLPRFPEVADMRTVMKGGGKVVTRVPLHSFVAPGFAAIGDAAYQTCPFTGCGIATSLYAARICAEVLAECCGKADHSREALWEYNYRYMTGYGHLQAMMYEVSRGLRETGEAALNEVFDRNFIDPEEIAGSVKEGKAELSFFSKLKVGLHLVSHPKLALRLRKILSRAKRLRRHYGTYPDSPEGFGKWKERTVELLNG